MDPRTYGLGPDRADVTRAVGMTRLYVYRPTPAGATWTFPVPPPEGGAFSRASDGQMVAVSPDGGTIAFLAGVPGGPQMIWLRSRDALERVRPCRARRAPKGRSGSPTANRSDSSPGDS